MSKLRRNHRKSSRGSSFMGRMVIITVLLVLAIVGLTLAFVKSPFSNKSISYPNIEKMESLEERYYLPSDSHGEIVHHKYYSLSYIEKHEQAEWVAYELTSSDLRVPNVKRSRKFKPDYSVKTQSAFHRDYSHSGYTRGHLAPAGDMAFNQEAMQESFYMSNMSPQLGSFNGGIWRELEEQVRDWAFDDNHLYIVTGPVLKNIDNKIGKNKVGVPKHFYKIILDLHEPDYKIIAFLMPNESSALPLQDYVVSVDEIEELTGINFFDELIDDNIEEKMEQSSSLKNWKFNNKRFQQRIKTWNNH